MKIDRDKILTCLSADQAKVGDMGWFADNFRDLVEKIEQGKDPQELSRIHEDVANYRFVSDGNEWALFHPADYKLQQKLWLEKNKLDVWDTVCITRAWQSGERGFEYDWREDIQEILGSEFSEVEWKVSSILSDFIGLKKDNFFFTAPFFVIKKIEDESEPRLEYYPFSNAEEFRPHRDRWLYNDGDWCRVVHFNNEGVVVMVGEEGDFTYYGELLSKGYFFEDGTPAGVKM